MSDLSNSPSSEQMEKGVPLLDFSRQHDPLFDEIIESLTKVCRSNWYVLGPEVTRLEKSVAEYCQAEHAVGCASGSDSLLLALMALDVGPGDEVIVPSFTFFATASVVTRLGATPVFADIEPKTFNIDPADVRAKLTDSTKAIIPVHLFGQCADMDELCQIAEEAGVSLVEDMAQSIGAKYENRLAGGIGTIGCISFYPTKNLGGAGDGGMLTTNDEKLAQRLSNLRGHGMNPRYYHSEIGINSRLDAFQAAFLNVKFPHLDEYADARAANADRYFELFSQANLEQFVQLPVTAPNRRHVWNQYVVRIADGKRDELRAFLQEKKVGAEIYYPLGLHDQECFKYLGYGKGDLPETDRAAEEVLALPIYPELTAEEQKVVVARIGQFFRSESTGGHKLAKPNILKPRRSPVEREEER
jgi:dTDP-4-amino-4,6-dideoxygalactose transaminase